MPKVSVIIPVYNVEEYLRECLDSVVNQTLKDIEIICIDDGSTDSSLEILKEYAQKDNRFVILEQENQGAGAARNKGLEVAQGEYLYFLDSDDFIQDYLFEKVCNHIELTKSDICIFKNYCLNNKTKKITFNKNCGIGLTLTNKSFNIYDFPNDIFLMFNIPAFTKLYKKDFIKNNCIYFQEIKTCNDVFFNFYTLSKAKSIIFLDEYLVTYRTFQINNLTSKRYKHIENVFIAYTYLKEKLEKDELFKTLEKTFYKRFASSIDFEISLLPQKEINKNFLEKNLKNLPKEYWTESIKKIFENKFIRLQQKIFSITYNQETKHKIITILGIKIKRRNIKCQKLV